MLSWLHSANDLTLSCRLRTRTAWVQRAETDLEEKRVHCLSIPLHFVCHGYFHTEQYSHHRCQSGQGIRKCACPSWWSLRCQSQVLTWFALGAPIVIMQSESEMDNPPGHRNYSPQTRVEETVVVQKGFFTAALTSLSVYPRPKAAGEEKIDKIPGGLSSEVEESSSYHIARCVAS